MIDCSSGISTIAQFEPSGQAADQVKISVGFSNDVIALPRQAGPDASAQRQRG